MGVVESGQGARRWHGIARLNQLGLAARGGWGDTTLSLDGRWRDLLTGRVSDGALAGLLDTYPVALLVEESR